MRGYANFGSRQKSIFEHKGIQFLKRQHKKGFWKQLRQLFFGGAVLFFFREGGGSGKLDMPKLVTARKFWNF